MTNAIILDSVKNDSTSTNLLPIGRGKSIEVIEFGQKSIIFQSPTKSAKGHLISVSGKILIAGRLHPFKATGQILNVTELDKASNRFEIQFHQYDKITWARFLEEMGKKQGRANDLFKKIRGEV
jgi:hypothetical protein